MPGEVIGEVAGGVLRFIGRMLLEGVFEFLIKGVGYLICRPFKRNVHPDGVLVVLVGLVFWVAVGAVFYAVQRQL
jgi:hypothetical protein